MSSSQIVPFAVGAGANTLTAADYVGLPEVQTGFQAGTASSKKVNTALRQALFVAAAFAKFTADYNPDNVLDDGNVGKLENQFLVALRAAVATTPAPGIPYEGYDTGTTSNGMFVATTSPVAGAPAVGQIYLIYKNNITTVDGGTTLKLASAAPKPLYRVDGSPLQKGDWQANAPGFVVLANVQNVLTYFYLGPYSFAAAASAAMRRRDFVASDTLTVTPDMMTGLVVEGVAPGGGGGCTGDGSGGGATGNAGAGGGSGAYGYKLISAASLTLGQAIPVTIGAPGAKGTYGTNNGKGGNGAASSFGSFMTLGPGLGGVSGISTVGPGGLGGTATGADFNIPGSQGGPSGPNVNTVTLSDALRTYAVGATAGGGYSVPVLSNTGGDGLGFGSGGGGASGGNGLAGGAGAPSIIRVRW